jgi:hypothetical protein
MLAVIQIALNRVLVKRDEKMEDSCGDGSLTHGGHVDLTLSERVYL